MIKATFSSGFYHVLLHFVFAPKNHISFFQSCAFGFAVIKQDNFHYPQDNFHYQQDNFSCPIRKFLLQTFSAHIVKNITDLEKNSLGIAKNIRLRVLGRTGIIDKKQPNTEMLDCDWFDASTIHT